LERVGLKADAADRRVVTYFKGMRQKVAIALALASGAKALLLDEPIRLATADGELSLGVALMWSAAGPACERGADEDRTGDDPARPGLRRRQYVADRRRGHPRHRDGRHLRDLLVQLKVFNTEQMNQAIFAFRRYEDASLRYTGIESHEGLRHYGLYDTVIAKET
jgi:hypothetical protein